MRMSPGAASGRCCCIYRTRPCRRGLRNHRPQVRRLRTRRLRPAQSSGVLSTRVRPFAYNRANKKSPPAGIRAAWISLATTGCTCTCSLGPAQALDLTRLGVLRRSIVPGLRSLDNMVVAGQEGQAKVRNDAIEKHAQVRYSKLLVRPASTTRTAPVTPDASSKAR